MVTKYIKYEMYLENVSNIYIDKNSYIVCVNKSIPQKCIGFINDPTFSVSLNNNGNCIIIGNVTFFDNKEYEFVGFETREDGALFTLVFKEKENSYEKL